MSKVLKTDLSSQGLEQIADFLEDYATTVLPKNCDLLIDEMCKKGEDWAINGLGHIDTGETLTTIMGYREGNTGLIVANGAAIWIEFGTGVTYNGAGYNYPKAVDGIVGHGEFGEGNGANIHGWFYIGNDGEAHHTYGIPANHFMYNTAQALKSEYWRIAREVFK